MCKGCNSIKHALIAFPHLKPRKQLYKLTLNVEGKPFSSSIFWVENRIPWLVRLVVISLVGKVGGS